MIKFNHTLLSFITVCALFFSFVMISSQEAASKHPPNQFSWAHFPWQSTLNRDHPLNGKIWSVHERRFISPKTLIQRLKNHPYIGLGETHDNPDHHILQAWIIDEIVADRQRKPDIVMEMIDTDQNLKVQSYLARPNPTATGLSKILNWHKSGWPDWSLYAPIAQISLEAKLVIRAGNPSKKRNKSIGKKGFDVLGQTQKEKLHLHIPLADDLESDLKNQIVTGHCNMIPLSATAPMMRVQRFRDAVMAQNLLKSAPKDGAILIAGSGHVRLDRGVPWYIRQSGQKMVSVIMAEAQEDVQINPLDLVSKPPKGHIIADYIWITPRTEREDQCEKFKELMKRKHKLKPRP